MLIVANLSQLPSASVQNAAELVNKLSQQGVKEKSAAVEANTVGHEFVSNKYNFVNYYNSH